MASESLPQQQAQLDKEEREHLEAVVEDLRERVESNVELQLRQKTLEEEPEDARGLDEETRQLVEAIRLERVDGHTWDEAFEQYVTSVGYTIVNRLAALRCMEVRDFIDREVTAFTESGLTPAAEPLTESPYLEGHALVQAYHRACDELAGEIEILFDRSSAYSLVDPDAGTFEDLCGLLDEIPDAVWRADDVLGWIYEYYNRPAVEAIDAKEILEPEDVGPANRFYTPHWVVRMLADNSLGKLYLEATGQASTVPAPEGLSPGERTERLVTPEDAPDVARLCTYLIPDEDEREAPSFDHPSELRVIDPACGSGHFLLYAFDILERIWWAETDLDRGDIPAKILQHNLYGVDIDLRSCRLAAFNLYLKARTRAEAEDNDGFVMPNLGIVCADARVAEVEEGVDVLDRITGERTDVRTVLDGVITQFQTTEALGSLLDVRGALAEAFVEEQADVVEGGGDAPPTPNEFLRKLEEAVDERASDSFGEQNLRSFLTLLVVLTQDYDVALMNPPYGSGGRMPDDVQEYVDEHYEYTTEYYINFFEACDRLVKTDGRVGMLVPRSFMFLKSFRAFREDFIGSRGSFDFLAEYGIDILDNATVRTAGTVVRSESETGQKGTFIRLGDVEKGKKEQSFVHAAFVDRFENGIQRMYQRDLSEFDLVPGTPLSYWVPGDLRSLYDSGTVLDADNAGLPERDAYGVIKQGIATADDSRFVHKFWEHPGESDWVPFANGGEDAWLLPRVKNTLFWAETGTEVTRFPRSYPRNTQYYFNDGLTYTVAKESGRRFGYLHPDSIFGHKGSVLVPERAIWHALAYTDSHLFTYLMLAQTTERMWEVGQVSTVPWRETLATIDELEDFSRRAVGHLVSKRQYDFVSPHYDGPVLLGVLDEGEVLPQYDHPHRDLREDVVLDEPDEILEPSASLEELAVVAARHLERVEADLQSCADAIDEAVFECFDVTGELRETVIQEIALRTNEDPREREEYTPEAICEPPDEFPEMVEDLLLHLAIRAVHEDDDGIVLLSDVEGEDDLLARIVDEFERLFGEHADARLAEVDEVLGSTSGGEEAYPNLRAWLDEDLFEYHVSTFDRTPILWRLTTERLVPDPVGEGFACLLDYHQLDGNVFDRLQNRYLEPRKALLRERRSVANRRRNDDSLAPSERAEATAEYTRCESGLDQIGVFEERLAALAQPSPRDWPEAHRDLANSAAERVAAFRERTASRLELLEKLADLDDVDVAELFSPSFYETVRENRDEWLDALADLEAAFEAYGNDGGDPVEAHLYDLFEYYDDLVGSSHYASTGILFTTYYFDAFEDAGQSPIGDDGVSERQRLLSELASGLEEYRDLASEIGDACDEIAGAIPAEWSDRARSEITTPGYRPKRKHGVVRNIEPLAEAEIVPTTVDERVI